MARPFKTNETPVAPFNLRESGPIAVTTLEKMLKGASFRVGAHDRAATQDRDPCPHCGARVIWAPTAKRSGDQLARFVYARCAANPEHSWGFRGVEPERATPPPPNASPRQNVKSTDTDLVKIADTLEEIGAALRKLAGTQVDLQALLNVRMH